MELMAVIHSRYKTRDSVFSYIIQLIFQVFFMYKELLYWEKNKNKNKKTR